MNPPIQYTKSGTINVAYQVFGSGPVDLVYIPGWVSNIDWMWACPELVDFFEELGKVARVILFDKRGTGLSDRVVEYATLEERMEDIRSVMDAVGSEKAILFGHSEGGSVSALFSATYPDRVLALTAFGIFAKRVYSEDYPWAPTEKQRQEVYDMIATNWGSGKMNLKSLAPSKANDTQFMNWLASYFRSGASPKAAMQLTKMNTSVNIIDILEHIKVPTLLMQRRGDIDVKIEEGEFIAKRIKGSKFVQFDGNDHLFWVGNTKEVLDEMKSFIKKIPLEKQYKKGLITTLFAHIEKKSKVDFKTDWICNDIVAYGGQLIKTDKEYFVVTFTSSKNATACSLSLTEKSQRYGIHATVGIYMREGRLDGMHRLQEEDLYMMKAIRLQSHVNQILISQTVKNLLSGGEFKFMKTTSILNFGSNALCELFVVNAKGMQDKERLGLQSCTSPRNDYFLENVLLAIDENIENSEFGIDELSQVLGVSERQLQRKTKEVTGKSPNSLIMSMRLTKAKSMLLSYKDTVSEVAFQFGFSSPSYFSKCFKKEFGVTPTDLVTLHA